MMGSALRCRCPSPAPKSTAPSCALIADRQYLSCSSAFAEEEVRRREHQLAPRACDEIGQGCAWLQVYNEIASTGQGCDAARLHRAHCLSVGSLVMRWRVDVEDSQAQSYEDASQIAAAPYECGIHDSADTIVGASFGIADWHDLRGPTSLTDLPPSCVCSQACAHWKQLPASSQVGDRVLRYAC